MWITLLVMAVAISLEPFRIGMTVLMLNRPRPTLQLLAFLCGGFAMGMSVGLVVLFVLQRRLLHSSHVSLPGAQILIGTLALLTAAVLAVQVMTQPASRPPQGHRLSRALDAGPTTTQRPFAVGRGNRRSGDRAAIGRLPGRARRHRGFRHRRPDPSRRAGHLSSRGVRARGDPPAGVSARTPADACVDGRAAHLDSVAAPARSCLPVGRGRCGAARRWHDESLGRPCRTLDVETRGRRNR
jgi:Sap, sulfolipid-1-addressing protein